MARKRRKMTPEERARRDETQRMVRERILYHEAKAREQGERPTGLSYEEVMDDADARSEWIQQLARERIAYHEAKAREEDERRARRRRWRLWAR